MFFKDGHVISFLCKSSSFRVGPSVVGPSEERLDLLRDKLCVLLSNVFDNLV